MIVLCVRSYLRYPLSYRDRWVLRYARILQERMRKEMRRPLGECLSLNQRYSRLAQFWLC